MIYAEKIDLELGITDKGIFLSLEEFAEYRAEGWSGDDEYNALADAMIARVRAMSTGSLKWMAPMMCGRLERWELHRRQYETS